MSNVQHVVTVQKGLAPWQQARALQLLDETLDMHLPVSRLAEHCALSRSDFTRKFTVSLGQSPSRFQRNRKIAKAKAMLREGADKLIDVALACGFYDQAHFCRTFSQAEGQSPLAWLRGQVLN